MTKAFLLTAAAFFTLVSVAERTAQAQEIRSGTRVDVRTDQAIDARDRVDGRIYTGTVANDVVGDDGRVMLPRGSRAELIVRATGDNDLSVDLDSVTVGDRRYSVDAGATEQTRRDGVGENKRTGEYVGGGALLGTLLGAIAGGGKGAAIGAIAGGAGGAGAQVLTRGKNVHIPPETVLSFRLDRPLSVYQDRGYERDGQHYHHYDNEPRDDRRYDNNQPRDDRR